MDNYFLRIECFGGLLFSRDNFDKWEINETNTIFMWLYFHIKDEKISLEYLKKIYDNNDIEINEDVVHFIRNNVYNIPFKWKTNKKQLVQKGKFIIEYYKNLNFLSAPLEVGLYITDMCQCKCKFCFMEKVMKKENELCLSEIKRLVNIFDENGVESLSILGGEPLLHKSFIEICEFINQKRIHFVITTNSLLLDDKILSKLSKLEYCTLVISLQSLDKLHKELTGIDYKKIVEKIHLAKKYNLKLRINTVYTTQTHEQINELLKFAINNNIERFSLSMMVDNGQVFKNKINIEDIKKVREHLYESASKLNYKNSNKIDVDFEGCMLYSAYYSKENYEISKFQKINSGCQASSSKIDILSNGTAVPCTTLSKFVYLNVDVFNKSFEEIWFSERFNAIRGYQVDDIMCNDCNFKMFCNGGCFKNKQMIDSKFEKFGDKDCYRR